ncbi:MAG: hypothetical protein AB7E55_03235 [Pigmentiphaga sp.]
MNKRFLLARLLRNTEGEGGGGGDGGAGAQATPPAAASATPPPDPTPTPAWHESIQDEGLKAFIAGKNFKDAGEAAKALQDLEGKTAPPESAEAYALPVPEGGDKTFATEAAKWMHEAGIPVAQAQALATQWNAYMASQQQAADVARQQQDEAGTKALKAEWGGQYDANVELGRRAVRTFVGQGDEAVGMIEKIESALGAAETLRLFQRIGKHLGEGSLTPEGSANGAGTEKGLAELMYPTMQKG